jgi:acetylornithine deacetylase/succinyl-diaminopimelate desuccinylase-like protein
MKIRALFACVILGCVACAGVVHAQSNDAADKLAREIFKQLIEINTTDSVGNTTIAAEAMAMRLREAGYPAGDVQILGPNARKGNLVARLRGTGAHKPILLLGHLDVVEARREDWSMDPFQFIEKDGFFYGRGTLDIKGGDAILMVNMIRLEQEGYKPDRDIILALTADEEGGDSNGVAWLLENHRELIEAEYSINVDAGDFEMENGKKKAIDIEASEKQYRDFELKVTSTGGHSSLPTAENAIYELAQGLVRLEHYQFPFELNEVSRAYFARTAEIAGGEEGADMKAILGTPPDEAAIARLSRMPFYNARMRTTCVATMLDGGHARNALPATARANVNCRALPGHSTQEIQATLEKILDGLHIKLAPVFLHGAGTDANPPTPLREDVMQALERVGTEMSPGVPVVPVMDAGASDSSLTRAAGIPSYGVPGFFYDIHDDRSHGRDERMIVSCFYEGVDFYYRFLKTLASPQ